MRYNGLAMTEESFDRCLKVKAVRNDQDDSFRFRSLHTCLPSDRMAMQAGRQTIL